MPLMSSGDVADKNDHKLWWGDVVRLDDGSFQIITYAQLFSNLKPGELRTYPEHKTYAFEAVAIREIEKKYERKKVARCYKEIKSRENSFTPAVTSSNESIIEFLKKYG